MVNSLIYSTDILKNRSILIVEDNPNNIRILEETLTQYGCQVLVAQSGAEALQRADRGSPDLILLDIMLPDINGFDVCIELKNNDKTSRTPVIFLTALHDSRHKIRGFTVGGVDYVTKPINTQELIMRVITHLRLYFLTEKLEQEIYERTQSLQKTNKRLQAEIKEREEAEHLNRYFAMIVENMMDACISTDMQFNVTSWNPAAEKMYGYTGAEVIGKPLNDIIKQIYPEDNREEVLEIFQKEGFYSGEFIHHHKDSTAIPIWGVVSVMKDESGKPLRAFAINRELSERKKMEQNQIDLQVAIKRNQFLSEFLANMSHDIKTPISIIKTSLYLLSQSGIQDKQVRFITKIEKQADYLQNMIEDILLMSRLESLPEFETAQLNLTLLIEDIVNQLTPKVEQKKQILEVLYDKSIIMIGNESSLRSALSNIIENAINYTGNRGTISIDIKQTDNDMIIRVSDTGMGISSTDLQHIFDRFYRADDARSGNTGGTGLGLAISKKIIEMHNGFIHVNSQPGIGTIFEIRLSASLNCM